MKHTERNEEVKEGNKLIANSPFSNKSLREAIERDLKNHGEIYAYGGIMYHSSWDWLMPVVEKIEKHGCIVEIWLSNAKGCRITKVLSKTKSWSAPVESNNTIEAVYQAVVEFIKWFNQQST